MTLTSYANPLLDGWRFAPGVQKPNLQYRFCRFALRMTMSALWKVRVFNRRYEPAVIGRDRALKASLLAEGMEAKSFNAALLFEPHTVQNKAGRPFQVFTPYWRHCQTLPVEEPVKLKSGALPAPAAWPARLP